jgi:hypothetical protein
MEKLNDGRGGAHQVEAPDAHGDANGGINKILATVVVVAAGAAIFEAALLPGLVLGIAAMAAPKYLPGFSSAIAPVFKSTVRGAQDAFADARGHVNGLVAEAKRQTPRRQIT